MKLYVGCSGRIARAESNREEEKSRARKKKITGWRDRGETKRRAARTTVRALDDRNCRRKKKRGQAEEKERAGRSLADSQRRARNGARIRSDRLLFGSRTPQCDPSSGREHGARPRHEIKVDIYPQSTRYRRVILVPCHHRRENEDWRKISSDYLNERERKMDGRNRWGMNKE